MKVKNPAQEVIEAVQILIDNAIKKLLTSMGVLLPPLAKMENILYKSEGKQTVYQYIQKMQKYQ